MNKELLKKGSSHYKGMAIEPIEFIVSNNLSFLVGNIIKYVCRYDKADNVKALADLRKAQHYLEVIISTMEKNETNRSNRPVIPFADLE